MKIYRIKGICILLLSVLVTVSGLSLASAEDYEAMKGIDSVKVMFDMRDGVPEIAAGHMTLILDTWKELSAMGKSPEFVIVFMGSAVRLISTNRTDFSSEERKHIEKIADTVSMMSEAGIRLEACLAAVKYFKIDPGSVLPGIKRVGNGWISEIGYQAQGYQLVPVY